MPLLDAHINAAKESEVLTNGLRTMLLLERHKEETGSYPESLDVFPHDWMHTTIADSDQRLLYRRLDPSQDQAGRGYLLYVPGADGEDDSGTAPESDFGGIFKTEYGEDYIINKPD